jgi:hypothetical protein
VNGRSRDQMPGVVKLGLGVGLGYLLYKLLGGGGFGFGPGEVPSRPHDEQPIEVRIRPVPADSTKAEIALEGRIVSLGELIARIRVGGRRDVLVALRGDTRQGAWDEIREALESAGIQIVRKQAAGASVHTHPQVAR